MNNIEILIDNFEQLKKNKFIIESIDPEFFFKFGENLIQEYKKLKNKCNQELNFKYTTWVDDNFIPKSKVKEKIDKIQELQINYVDGITFDHIILELEELLEGE